MRRLHLQCEHKPVESRDEAPLVGEVHVEQQEARGVLLTPEPYDPNTLATTSPSRSTKAAGTCHPGVFRTKRSIGISQHRVRATVTDNGSRDQ
jgi:hypothetical protein